MQAMVEDQYLVIFLIKTERYGFMAFYFLVLPLLQFCKVMVRLCSQLK